MAAVSPAGSELVEGSELCGTLTIYFKGNAVDDNALDVRTFAPALLDIAALLERTVKRVHGDECRVTVKVKADFRRGSFEAVLYAVMEHGKQVVDFLDTHQSFGSIPEIILFVFGGVAAAEHYGSRLIGAVRALGNEKIQRVERPQDPNAPVRLVTATSSIDVHPALLPWLGDPEIRKAVAKLAKDAFKDKGIEELRLSPGADSAQKQAPEPAILTPDDVRALEAPTDDLREAERLVTEREMWLWVVTVDLGDVPGKWKFGTGDRSRITATIRDRMFRQDIDDGRTKFGKGDKLRAMVRTTQEETNGNPKITYEVMHVIEHIGQRTQNKLL